MIYVTCRVACMVLQVVEHRDVLKVVYLVSDRHDVV